ncbi:MAG: hypothetical protein ABSE22_23445, partial [Xanthobacteraceae bacterium]
RDTPLLHTGVDQHLGRADCDKIGEMKCRDCNAAGVGESRRNLCRGFGAHAFDTINHPTVAEQNVMESHAAAYDRREGIVCEDDIPSGATEMHANCRRNLIGAEDDDEREWRMAIHDRTPSVRSDQQELGQFLSRKKTENESK